ncbi:SDR family NAD(P)-dependent oxidoreductase [Niabella aurantiaca]|uniref:SDR family NAD(P)-dependent oxidoreductase n=1 Tax=Niabella aurantiaca TaxID=379900 RepID=UPI00036C4641|nr:SDR family oxidoreductase [Niabella aurantiaca]
MKIQNKTAIITGGTQGIGASTALELAQKGYHIALVARHSGDGALQKEIEKKGVSCHTIEADLGHEDSCSKIAQEVDEMLGNIYALIHCAGGAAPGSLLNVSREIWYQAFDIHIHAAFHLSRSVVPYMRKNKEGFITFISSAAGIRGVKNALAYAVVKGALPQLTRCLAFELSDDNIRVNCVAPGVIRTRFQDFLTPEQVKNNLENRIPLHKEGSPDEVAAVIAMLIDNGFITGENIIIDGGMSMRVV